MNENQYINSKLFGVLFEEGGQSLVAAYVMLLKGRNGFHYYKPEKKSNNKISKGMRLISEKSGVSLTSLKKYIPILIDLDLCYFTKDGGFFMVGSEKISNKFKKTKKIPVLIGKNLRQTKGNVNAVLIIANLSRQTNQIDKKITLNKALRKCSKNIPLSAEEASLVLKASKNKDIDLDNLKKVENIVLSNIKISKLIGSCNKETDQNLISNGSYWRKELERRGFIFSRRRYREVWNEKVSYSRFLEMRSYLQDIHGYVTYKNNRVVKPVVSEVMITCKSNVNSIIYNTNIINSIYKKKVEVEVTPPALS